MHAICTQFQSEVPPIRTPELRRVAANRGEKLFFTGCPQLRLIDGMKQNIDQTLLSQTFPTFMFIVQIPAFACIVFL